MPKRYHVKVSKIQWDLEIDGEIAQPDPPRPSELEVTVEAANSLGDAVDQAISIASDEYGWCILESEVNAVKLD